MLLKEDLWPGCKDFYDAVAGVMLELRCPTAVRRRRGSAQQYSERGRWPSVPHVCSPSSSFTLGNRDEPAN